MAIFAGMLQAVRTFLNRPVAEDFRFKSQIWQSLQSGIYVFLFIYFFGGSSFMKTTDSVVSGIWLLALFGAGCVVTTLLANWVVPALLPTLYDEDRWTVWKYILQTLLVLFCVSAGNQILLILLHRERPTFGQMYLTVTVIGFFPILLSVFITEQRRLKRNLAHAQALNDQLAHRAEPMVGQTSITSLPKADKLPTVVANPVVLVSDTGKERLTLQPDQLIYIESVGNYVEVHWLNGEQLQETVLRSTLKELVEVLADYPQFFRSHRAFLVNLKRINQTEGNARGYQLTLTSVPTKIPVSRGYIDAFDERIRSYYSFPFIPNRPE